MPNPPAVSFLDRPARHLDASRLDLLVRELREVAATCFAEVPDYGILAAEPDALDAAVLTLARDGRGRLVGFCAARRLDVPGVGGVLHLGLTCVRPDARGARITHALLSRAVGGYVLRHAPLTGVWVTNVASVLSSLGNVALHFEDVVPSPYRTGGPSPAHRAIAACYAERHRDRLHLRPESRFDASRSVFVGGNRGNVFHKRSDDGRYHHRDRALTGWYTELADLDGGDAVLQVGRASLAGFLRYAVRAWVGRVPGLRWLVVRRPMVALPAFVGGGR